MTRGCELLGLTPSFGFGDRTGLATPGHVAAMQQAGGAIAPIFPQQSIREMTRTRRTPQGVMADALQAARSSGWTGPIGADADHLKTTQDIDITAAAGFTFFTLDPSDHVDQQADNYGEAELKEKYHGVAPACLWTREYEGRVVQLSTGTAIEFSPEVCQRAAVKYGRAISAAAELARYIERVQRDHDRPFEIELSVDETSQPTTLAEHFIIADQLLRGGMKLVSLAPRFIGEFEKGVDFKGDIAAFERSLHDHAAIAQLLGPYKLSLHSGSDKLSIYPLLARATAGRFHVKTAGTSYLEALRVVARHEPEMFRAIINFARNRYDTDKATYHVSATLGEVPAPENVSRDAELEQLYLECWEQVPAGAGFTQPGRQILHCTFGSVLTDPQWGPTLLSVLRTHAATYTEILADHFARHLRALS